MTKSDTIRCRDADNVPARRWGLSRFTCYRPRALTLLLLATLGALLFLTNQTEEFGVRRVPAKNYPAYKLRRVAVGLSPSTSVNLSLDFDVRKPVEKGQSNGIACMSYGWPLLWRQYLIVSGLATFVVGEVYSGGRLAANAAIWLVMLVTPAAVCEWLLRRYRPRLRFSLRTLLAATAFGAALCGWFAAARNRANIQDALISAMDARPDLVWVERWGPKWFDLVGGESFRRCIIGAQIRAVGGQEGERDGKRLLSELKRLPDLRYLSFEAEHLTPEIARAFGSLRRLESLSLEFDDATGSWGNTLGAALKGMRRLRVLSVDGGVFGLDDATESHELLAAITSLPQLEYLQLGGCIISREDFALLARLTNLKSLILNSISAASDEYPPHPPLLSGLPPLPRLEMLDLEYSEVYDADLPYVAALPQLKSLNLSATEVTGTGLAELQRLEWLESLAIGEQAESRAAFESLLRFKRLRTLHTDDLLPGSWESSDALRERWPRLSHGEFDERLGALVTLRKAKPELVIGGSMGRSLGWPSKPLSPQCETIPDSSTLPRVQQAVRAWKEQQSSNSIPAGAVNRPGSK